MRLPPKSKCRSCGARVYWAKSIAGGRNMPVDVEPAPAGNVLLTWSPSLGRLYFEVIGKDDDVDPERNRYVSHFSTCEDAEDWRKS